MCESINIVGYGFFFFGKDLSDEFYIPGFYLPELILHFLLLFPQFLDYLLLGGFISNWDQVVVDVFEGI